MHPQLSIIIPVYNAAPFLSECLDSVLSQTISDIEIICVNDGSTDDSLAILQRYATIDSRVKVFSQKNQGVSVARNFGLQQSTGDYVCFVDADDKIILDTEIFNLLANGCDFIYYNHAYIDYKKETRIEVKSSLKTFISNEQILKEYIYYSRFKLCMGSYIVRRTVLLKNYICFDSNYKYGEDILFLYRILINISSLYFIDKTLIYISLHSTSAMGKKPSLRRFDIYKARMLFLAEMEKSNKLSIDFINFYKESVILESIVDVFELLTRSLSNPILLKKYMKENNIFKYIDELNKSNNKLYIKACFLKNNFYKYYFKTVLNHIFSKLKTYIYNILH